jgi:alpha-glucosidase (family GH31 glycosyl hydrolase)
MAFKWKTAGLVALAASPLVLGYTPTIDNSTAPNAQAVCPGYHASNVKHGSNKLTATLTLAGKACNVYGTDIESLDLNVEYQDAHRLAVTIQPTFMVFIPFILTHSLVQPMSLSMFYNRMPKTSPTMSWIPR